MKKLLIILTALLALPAFAIGSNPRMMEEIAWGGGYGSTGGWLEADGDLLMNGNLTVGGTLALTGTFSGTNISLSGTLAVAGTATFTGQSTFTSASYPPIRNVRQTATTNSALGSFALQLDLTSGSMADGYGPAMVFEGDGGGSLGQVAAVRNGADTTGKILLRPSITGTATTKVEITGTGGTFGSASTDVFAMTGRLQLRSVTDSSINTSSSATAGSAREILYNSSDSRWYASIAGGSPAMDWGYFLRNTDATQVLKNSAGVTLTLKDSDSTAGVSTISAEGTSGSSTTYGGAITFTAGGGVAIYQDPSPTNTSNNRVRSVLYGAGSSLATFGDNGTAGANAHVELQRSSDSIPAVMEVESADGTASYYFAGNNRTLRQHTAAPTANTDGEFAIPDGLFGAQVGSLLSTERTTTSASYTQVTGTGSGLAVTISERTSEVIVDYQGKVAGDNGSIKVVLATTDTGTAMPNGAETAGGYFYDSGSALALSQSVQTLTTAAHSSYTKFRCHIRATRLAAGTYYVNIFYLNDVGGGSTTYIDEISVYTN